MKIKSLLLTAALAAGAMQANAQYVIDSTLCVPHATEATDVSDFGFTANWKQLTLDDYLETNSIGFYVSAYAVKRAKEEGEKFYYINTDFSFLRSNATVDNPTSVVTMDNWPITDYLGDPTRPKGWKVINAGSANGVLCLDCKLNQTMCNGQFALCYGDLRNGDGVMHVKFKIRGDGNTKSFVVYLRDCSEVPNIVLDKYEINDLTTEWKEVEFTLQPKPGELDRLKLADMLFMCNDLGNLSSMYLFVDDLQVWQEMHKGEVGRIMYQDTPEKFDDMEATSYYFTTGDLLEGEEYAYTVSTYSTSAHSPESNMVFVNNEGTGISHTEASADADPNTPVTVYNLAGQVVARGTAANMPAMPKGAVIVKTGDKVKKMLVK